MTKQELRKETLRLLRNRPHCLTLLEIAQAIEVPLSWMNAFSREQYPKNPKLARVEKLYAYLTGQAHA